jgi:hypothetical protein
MIMPYGRKAVQVEPSINAPGDIGFNALWDRAFVPTIQDSATNPLRVDQDTGAPTVQEFAVDLESSVGLPR